MKKSKNKFILDACCGPKMMWFNKHHPNVLYCDIRNQSIKTNRGEYIHIRPDLEADYTDLPFADDQFQLVVMDPPHITRSGIKFDLTRKYGILNPETWQGDLKKGIKECMRVLKPLGVFIFKWNDCDIRTDNILKLFPYEPLFGQTTTGNRRGQTTTGNRRGKTRTTWFVFMKIPKSDGRIKEKVTDSKRKKEAKSSD